MGTLWLHNGRIGFYLLCFAVLLFAYLWDYLRHAGATDDDLPTPGHQRAHGLRSLFPAVVGQKALQSVSGPFRRTDKDKEAQPARRGHRPQAPTDPSAAPSPENRRQ
jgi:hypothetical protein